MHMHRSDQVLPKYAPSSPIPSACLKKWRNNALYPLAPFDWGPWGLTVMVAPCTHCTWMQRFLSCLLGQRVKRPTCIYIGWCIWARQRCLSPSDDVVTTLYLSLWSGQRLFFNNKGHVKWNASSSRFGLDQVYMFAPELDWSLAYLCGSYFSVYFAWCRCRPAVDTSQSIGRKEPTGYLESSSTCKHWRQ